MMKAEAEVFPEIMESKFSGFFSFCWFSTSDSGVPFRFHKLYGTHKLARFIIAVNAKTHTHTHKDKVYYYK